MSRDQDVLFEAVRRGDLKPEDHPGRENQALRLLIRAVRSTIRQQEM